MNLWLVPAIEIALATALFAGTYAVDRAVYDGHHALPSWVLSGSADSARQILIALAAAVITVIGVVFSIMIVTLTLASTQFGPRMLRNFIRDRGTQVTLGTFVATFVYAVLALASIGPGSHGDFVPHISVTVLLALVLVDVGVLVYFIHHIARSIQLPQVIASIARDLSRAIDIESMPEDRGYGAAGATGPSVAELLRAHGRARRYRRGARQRLPAVRPPRRAGADRRPRPARSSTSSTARATSWSAGSRWRGSGPRRPRPRSLTSWRAHT